MSRPGAMTHDFATIIVDSAVAWQNGNEQISLTRGSLALSG